MERENDQLDQNQCQPTTQLEQPPRKPPLSGGGGGGDRLKRDEWSEGAVSSLLEAYESKWVLRNRAKLKGQDWEDVARHVSSRANNTKSPKTQTQCKNKIESMKKRYRSESATGDKSSWPLFLRLDHLLRGTGGGGGGPPPPQPPPVLKAATLVGNHGLVLLESSVVGQPLPPQPPPPPPPPPLPPPPEPSIEIAQNSPESNGVDSMAKDDEEIERAAKLSSEQVSDKKQKQQQDDDNPETDSSTPALYNNDREGHKVINVKRKRQRRRRRRRDDGSWEDIAESIRWLAEAVVRSEQSRMDTMREVERMRVEAEAKRGEMDLKRTEIIANTQLEIARLFASAVAAKTVDSSLRIGRS